MKKILLSIALVACCLTSLLAQPCLPEGITFSTQVEIDNFQTNYPGCTEIEGDVLIIGDEINNLIGLNVLNSVGGYLHIYDNPSLASLTGLDSLSVVGGEILIYGNHSLTSLANFENLNYISNLILGKHYGFNLYIGNESLVSLAGLENLTDIGGNLHIHGNHSITDLTGLEGLTFIGNEFRIYGNDSITTFNGIENLSTIDGDLQIGKAGTLGSQVPNPALYSISALNNLTSIGGNLSISNNHMLTNLTGLENLASIGGNLLIGRGGSAFIGGNETMTSLSGIENINPGSIEDITIWGNSQLNECHVQSICDYLEALNGTVSIGYNAPGCDSPEQLEEACLTDVQELSFDDSFTISPNPCSSSINLRFTIAEQGLTICDLFTISGIKVKSIMNEIKMHGTYEMEIDLRDLPEGVYFCVLQTDDGVLTRKIIKL